MGNCAVAGSFPRHALLQQLMGVVRVDSLSSCLHNTGSRRVPTPRAQETAALLRYKFVLAVENSVCPDYITEKALRPYRVGAVPIVFEARGPGGGADGAGGAGVAGGGDRPPVPNYAQYFPKGSYINAAAFDSFEALGAHLRAVGSSRELWMKYHAHRDAATAPRRLAEWRQQHRRAIGDPACRLAHRTLAFVCARQQPQWGGATDGSVPPHERELAKGLAQADSAPSPRQGWRCSKGQAAPAARQNGGPRGVAVCMALLDGELHLLEREPRAAGTPPRRPARSRVS